jgi:hypothetical protein
MTDVNTKLKAAVWLTLLVSSYLHVDYSAKLLRNRIVNGKLRSQISQKIKPTKGLAHGMEAKNLSIIEYREIAKMNWFPKLPDQATGINYEYQYDGFLPDYSFL